MVRHTLVALMLSSAAAYAADGKEETCKYQGQVIKAIQDARLDRVKAKDLEEYLV